MDKKTDQKRITSKDVAIKAGVSQSTVSRVLSTGEGSSFISKETSIRVRETAEELGYSPNPIARALRGEKTNLIGLIVREIADPFFAGVIEELSFGFRREGFNVILGHVHSDPMEGMQITRVLDSRQCDGMIFLGDLRDDMKYIRATLNEGHPAVTMCRGNQADLIPYVNCNNASGINKLINHLIEFGHKRIAFIDGGYIGDIRERKLAFLNSKKHHPDVEISMIQAEKNNYDGGFNAMKLLLESGDIPTAVMAADDGMAVGVISAIKKAGLNVPDQISVTGFDDIELAKYTCPPLTTIRQPIEEMSKKAIQMILRLIRKEPMTNYEAYITLEPTLIIRDSTTVALKKSLS